MAIAIQPETAPLRIDEHGSVRVGDTRVLLDFVVRAFERGATPESIVQMYPSLTLADTYAAVSFYLRHTENVSQYLAEREREAAEIRKEIEARQPDMADIRRRLLARRDAAGGNSPEAAD